MDVVFSDMDGTLLEHSTYSFAEAQPALDLLKSRGIPLDVCTSKTRSEVEFWRRLLGNKHPFIVENGGAARSLRDAAIGNTVRRPGGKLGKHLRGDKHEEHVPQDTSGIA
jgi:predicted mannosyl-3-phosphoglycerate phosphatase (HAD superfamily)